MKAHLAGLAVSVWTSLPLRRAERGHAVLTVNDRTIVQRLTARASRLQETERSRTVWINETDSRFLHGVWSRICLGVTADTLS